MFWAHRIFLHFDVSSFAANRLVFMLDGQPLAKSNSLALSVCLCFQTFAWDKRDPQQGDFRENSYSSVLLNPTSHTDNG